jgi:hypothetical protein
VRLRRCIGVLLWKVEEKSFSQKKIRIGTRFLFYATSCGVRLRRCIETLLWEVEERRV